MEENDEEQKPDVEVEFYFDEDLPIAEVLKQQEAFEKRKNENDSTDEGPKKKKRKRNDEKQKNTNTETKYTVVKICWSCFKHSPTLKCQLCPRWHHENCASKSEHREICSECRKEILKESSRLNENRPPISELTEMLSYATESDKLPMIWNSFLDNNVKFKKPMDLKILRENVLAEKYGTTQAFLSDVRWIMYNARSLRPPNQQFTSYASAILNDAKKHVVAIDRCPSCYKASYTDGDVPWFTRVCKIPHLLVYARMKSFSYWPAKVYTVEPNNRQVTVRFFGEKNEWATLSEKNLLLLTKTLPRNHPRQKDFYDAMVELQAHVKELEKKFPVFVYAEDDKNTYSVLRHKEQLQQMLPSWQNIQNDPNSFDGAQKLQLLINSEHDYFNSNPQSVIFGVPSGVVQLRPSAATPKRKKNNVFSIVSTQVPVETPPVRDSYSTRSSSTRIDSLPQTATRPNSAEIDPLISQDETINPMVTYNDEIARALVDDTNNKKRSPVSDSREDTWYEDFKSRNEVQTENPPQDTANDVNRDNTEEPAFRIEAVTSRTDVPSESGLRIETITSMTNCSSENGLSNWKAPKAGTAKLKTVQNFGGIVLTNNPVDDIPPVSHDLMMELRDEWREKDIRRILYESQMKEAEKTNMAATSEDAGARYEAVEIAKREEWCSNCLRPAKLRCCWKISYCSFACQLSHWPRHHLKCTKKVTAMPRQRRLAPKVRTLVQRQDKSVIETITI